LFKNNLPLLASQENDRAFGVLSRAAKKTKVIASSKSWMRLAAKAKGQPDPYHTAWLDRNFFRNWKKFLDEKYVRPSVWKNTDGDTVPLMKIRWFNFGVGEQTAAGGAVALVAHPDEVWYRLGLDASEPWKKIALVRRAGAGGVISDTEYDLHTAALSLPPEKVADLAKFKAWLPRQFHSLYPDPRAPPASENESDESDESDVSASDNARGEDEEAALSEHSQQSEVDLVEIGEPRA
jgi:hypothetical protein